MQTLLLKKRLKEGGLDKQVLGEHLIDLGVSGFYGVNERRSEKTNFVLYEDKIERLTRFIKIFKSYCSFIISLLDK